MGLKRLKKLKTVMKKRSPKNWQWYTDINPDGHWKANIRKVKRNSK